MLMDVGVYVEPDAVQYLNGIFLCPTTTSNTSPRIIRTIRPTDIILQVACDVMPVVLKFTPGPQFHPQADLVGHLIIDVGDEAQLLLDLVLHGLYCLWVCLPAPYLAGELTELLL